MEKVMEEDESERRGSPARERRLDFRADRENMNKFAQRDKILT